MKMEDIFKLCEEKNIKISRHENELVVQAPRGAMNADIALVLRENKLALLKILSEEKLDAADEKFTFQINPEMLTLVKLTQEEINGVVASVKGGAGNIKDIYPLAPLQEGILFHHLMQSHGDMYLSPSLLAFTHRSGMDSFLNAMKKVIDRHDILRTGFVWAGLDEPVQVVYRQAELPIEHLEFDSGSANIQQQLEDYISPNHFRIDVSQAPLIRCFFAEDQANQRWILAILIHHMVVDHTTLDLLVSETVAIQQGHEKDLPVPVPFRNFVAQARSGISKEENQAFFSEMLGDISESTMPFDIPDVQQDASDIKDAKLQLDSLLAQKLRQESKRLGVSPASMFHLAWGMVLARVIGREDIVFGTVLFGRMQAGAEADRGMGLFINTLPIRLKIGTASLAESLRQTHLLLIKLLKHEHASLALAQRSSSVAGAPLFTSLVNYRYQSVHPQAEGQSLADVLGFEPISGTERTNYPLSLAVDDQGQGFVVKVQAQLPISAQRVLGYLCSALDGLVENLIASTKAAVQEIDIIPASEKTQLAYGWNASDMAFPKDSCIHKVFEVRAAEHPDAIALVFEDQQITYAELNTRANQLAHHLRDQGVVPDSRVAICIERNIDMVVALLATHKAGGAYVPLDPAYPVDRLAHMLADSQPVVSLVHSATEALVKSIGGKTRVNMDEANIWEKRYARNNPSQFAKSSTQDLAYVIYTSGSTGKPKGVMVTHRNLMNFMVAMEQQPGLSTNDVLLNVTSLSFDIAGLEIFLPLLCGARTILTSRITANDPQLLAELMEKQQVTVMQATPSTWRMLVEHGWPKNGPELKLLCGGEALPADLARELLKHVPTIWNMYGPTETTVWSTLQAIRSSDEAITIGRPIANTQLYILDAKLQPVPLGASGELFIGGEGVARGYLNRPELTVERFLPDPFSRQPNARMYRTGDLCRQSDDGRVIYLGRNDFQVKIRGFRIELGEIENKLSELSQVKEAAVIAREEPSGEKRLVAYLVMREGHGVDIAGIRAELATDLPQHMIPSAFVQLPTMPLTPNGKLDRKALLEARCVEENSTPKIHSGRAPQSATEIKLAQQCVRLFNLHDQTVLSCDDDFFDLGGTSLTIIRMVSFIARECGVSIAVSDFFSYRTIGELAAFVDAQQTTTALQPVVSMGAENGEIVFCVPGVNGHALSFQNLATALPEYSLQCFEPIDIQGQTLASLNSFEELCDSYLTALKSIQPTGPYRLIGYSHGGLIAAALANRLQSMGETIDALGLIDTIVDVDRDTLLKEKAHRNLQALDADYMHFIFSNFEKSLICDLNVTSEYLATLDVNERILHVAQQLVQSNILQTIDTKYVHDYLIGRKQHEELLADYFFAQEFAVYDGNVCLFKANENPWNQRADISEDYGWGKFLTGNFTSISLPGSHESIVTSPQVDYLGAALKQFFEFNQRNQIDCIG